MSLTFTFNLRDNATPEANRIAASLSKDVLDARIGDACVALMQNHYSGLPSNKQGFPTTQFWQGAAENTSWNSTANGIVILTAQIGVRFQYAGGDITPGKSESSASGGGTTKYLTIAATAESYGKQASEFEGLKFVKFGRGPDAPAALYRPNKNTVKGNFKMGRAIGPTQDKRIALDVLYWLVTHVHKDENHSVIPSDDEFYGVIGKAILGRQPR